MVGVSTKWQIMDRLVPLMRAAEQRVLVLSQSPKSLDLVEVRGCVLARVPPEVRTEAALRCARCKSQVHQKLSNMQPPLYFGNWSRCVEIRQKTIRVLLPCENVL